MTDSYRVGFMTKCAELGVPHDVASSLLKVAEADPNLQRATVIFKDWLTVPKHVVQRGEILAGIARDNGVSVQDLAKFNGMDGRLFVRPGQVIRIPPKTEGGTAGKKG